MADAYITDFKKNTPNHFKYPDIISHEFIETDKTAIETEATRLRKDSTLPELVVLCQMRQFIGELVRDRVNENLPPGSLPILSRN
jgi:hypothetical protein